MAGEFKILTEQLEVITLHENSNLQYDASAEEIEKWADDVLKNCKSFIAHNVSLYRGMGTAYKSHLFGSKNIRTNRDSRDSSYRINKLMNYILKSKNLPLRNEVLFATRSEMIASEYANGSIFRVFLPNKSEHYWFPKIYDLFGKFGDYEGIVELLSIAQLDKISTFEQFITEVETILTNDPSKYEREREWTIELKNIVNKIYVEKKTFPGANMEHEVAIKAKSFYYGPSDFEFLSYQLKDMGNERLIKKMKTIYGINQK
jgi:hypothetical protein